jgi:nucleoside-diphosphate-sugar epimerase
VKIAIIGLGWLGEPLAYNLINEGHFVVGTTTSIEKKERFEKLSIPTIVWNSKVSDFQIISVFDKVDVVVINYPPGKQHDLKSYGDSILKVVSSFSNQTKFIFISSTSVYPDEDAQFNEDDLDIEVRATENNIAYAEMLLLKTIKNRLTIIRMAGLIGDQRHPAKFFAGRKDIPNGNSPVNLIFRKDAIQLIERCIKTNVWGEIINGSASIHPTKSEYYTFACKQFGFELPTFQENGSGKTISNSKSKNLLKMEYLMDNPFDYLMVNL